MTLSEQILDIREGLGKTQKEMSEILGLGIQQYHRYERGLSTPSHKQLQNIANKFNVVIKIYPKR